MALAGLVGDDLAAALVTSRTAAASVVAALKISRSACAAVTASLEGPTVFRGSSAGRGKQDH